MSIKRKIEDDFVNGRLYFYHTTNSLNAYSFASDGSWRSRKAFYGLGAYGFANPPSRGDGYGSITFKFQVLRFPGLFFANTKLGAEVINGYSVKMGLSILEDHDVPDHYITRRNGLQAVLEGADINSSVLRTNDTTTKCFLSKYDFDGMAYYSHDGYSIVFWNFTPQLLRVVGVKKSSDLAFKPIPIGASQKDVEDIFYDRVRKSTTGSSSTSAAQATDFMGFPISKYASASLLKHIYATNRFIFDYLKTEVTYWLSGATPTLKQIVLLESWYVRFNMTSRKFIYSGFTTDEINIVFLASNIWAFICTDSNVRLNAAAKVYLDRLNRYLLPFSLKNQLDRSYWDAAISLLSLDAYRRAMFFVPSFTDKSKATSYLLSLFALLIEKNVSSFTVFAVTDFAETKYGLDLVSLYNNSAPSIFSEISQDTIQVTPIAYVVQTGIRFL